MLWELRHYERICIVTLLCQKVEIIQSTYAIVAQDAGDSSSPAVLETNVILKPTRPHHCSERRERYSQISDPSKFLLEILLALE